MITNRELSTLNLSPTNKDFVQIWNELLEVAGKLSARWDPTSTNESDPGIVLLKALAGIADKLNYNIDKNILEAYMPTAAQRESMYKLCDMMGYNIKYYRSAETYASVWYTGKWAGEAEAGETLPERIEIQPFTVLSDAEDLIHYVTTNETPVILTMNQTKASIPCIEGALVECTSINSNNLITKAQLTSDNKFYLPELQIAENGIFIRNYINQTTSLSTVSSYWQRVDNLNTYPQGKQIFKFCYDSFKGRPYLQFPADIAELIQDGLKIYYIRTSGINGNIASRTLSKLTPTSEFPEGTDTSAFIVINEDVATTGCDLETLTDAYNNFKKTVGTFETLVTCRDYMNAIYNMVETDYTIDKRFATPLVSNVNVTDIRNDINRSVTICSLDEYGIRYIEKSLVTNSVDQIDHFDLVLYPYKTYIQQKPGTSDNTLVEAFKQSFRLATSTSVTKDIEVQLNPYKTVAHSLTDPKEGELISIRNYLKLNALIATSVKVQAAEGDDIIRNIKLALANAFNMRNLDFGEEIPFESILQTIENADARIKVVALQDPTVYTVFVVRDNSQPNNEAEYPIAWLENLNSTYTEASDEATKLGISSDQINTLKTLYNKLTLKNVLAGRVPLFDYNKDFVADFGEGPVLELEDLEDDDPVVSFTGAGELVASDGSTSIYRYSGSDGCYYSTTPGFTESNTSCKKVTSSNPSYPATTKSISKLEGKFILEADEPNADTYQNIVLQTNEVIKFRAPNFTTVTTYPAYVNYWFTRSHYVENQQLKDFDSDTGIITAGQSAITTTLQEAMGKNPDKSWKNLWKYVLENSSNDLSGSADLKYLRLGAGGSGSATSEITETDFSSKILCVGKITLSSGAGPSVDKDTLKGKIESATLLTKHEDLTKDTSGELVYIYYPLTKETIAIWNKFVQKSDSNGILGVDNESIYTQGFPTYSLSYLSYASTYPPGKLISTAGLKLLQTSSTRCSHILNEPFNSLVITYPGKDPVVAYLKANTEYMLQEDEYLYINYTTSEKEEDGSQAEGKPVYKIYGPGTIIKPNFDLYPSQYVSSYNKAAIVKENVPFVSSNGTQYRNLFTLGASEQIEIRDIMQLTPGLTDEMLQNGGPSVPVKFYYNFEWPVGKNTYELQTGEYFFISDKQGLSAAYYGSGTGIELIGGFNLLPSADTQVNIVSALTEGLHILPWKTQLVSKASHVRITEYQYHTLTAGNVLMEAESADTSIEPHEAWTPVKGVKYRNYINEDIDQVLPEYQIYNVNTEGLVTTVTPKYCWEMKTFLTLNTLNGQGQVLNYTAGGTDKTQSQDQIIISYKDASQSPPLMSDDPDFPKAFKTNYDVYSTTGEFTVTDKVREKSGDLKLRCYEPQEIAGIVLATDPTTNTPTMPTISPQLQAKLAKAFNVTLKNTQSSTALTSEIINETWVKSSGKDLLEETTDNQGASVYKYKPLALPIVIPNDTQTFGVFSIYIKAPKKFNGVPIKLVASEANAIQKIADNTSTNSINLLGQNKDSQLTCIKINKTCTLYLTFASTGSENLSDLLNTVILWDAVRYVNYDSTTNPQGINQSLLQYQKCFPSTGTGTGSAKCRYCGENHGGALGALAIISDIENMAGADQFYYTTPVENNIALEFGAGTNNVTMRDAEVFWDTNNINNHFVIPVIDLDYIDEGITIAKSSKY